MCLLQPLLLKWVDSKDVHTIDHHGASKTIKAQEEETGHTRREKAQRMTYILYHQFLLNYV